MIFLFYINIIIKHFFKVESAITQKIRVMVATIMEITQDALQVLAVQLYNFQFEI